MRYNAFIGVPSQPYKSRRNTLWKGSVYTR
jgi:hypothetical protein